jgi:hypothetical protein
LFVRDLTRLVHCGAGAAILLLVGCSGGGGGMETPASGGAVQQDSVTMQPTSGLNPAALIRREFPLLGGQASSNSGHGFVNSTALAKQPTAIAVSDDNYDVYIYDPAGNQLALLTGFNGSGQLASDIKGDLYVADYLNQRVQIYAAGFQSAPKTLNIPGYPVAVDSFNNGQILAVEYAISQGAYASGVEFYTNGQLTNTVNFPSDIFALGECSFDAVGNLFLGMYRQVGSKYVAVVGEIVGGARGNKFSLLTTSNKLYNPAGIQVTTDGKIAVGESSNFTGPGYSSNAIFTYNPPVGGSLGSPVSKTVIQGASEPIQFAFTKDMSSFYLADIYNVEVEQFAYPAGGNALSSNINAGFHPTGVAVIATQYPKLQK